MSSVPSGRDSYPLATLHLTYHNIEVGLHCCPVLAVQRYALPKFPASYGTQPHTNNRNRNPDKYILRICKVYIFLFTVYVSFYWSDTLIWLIFYYSFIPMIIYSFTILPRVTIFKPLSNFAGIICHITPVKWRCSAVRACTDWTQIALARGSGRDAAPH